MRRTLAAAAAVVLLGVLAVPVSASPATLWHRVNFSSPPAHERLICVGTSVWHCRYDLVPAPSLNFGWGRLSGMFTGATGTCPSGFDDLCSHAVQTLVGATTYRTGTGSSFTLDEDLIVTDGDGVAPLYMVILSLNVACPWFTSFGDALAANPFPLPYDGVNGPAPDCISA